LYSVAARRLTDADADTELRDGLSGDQAGAPYRRRLETRTMELWDFGVPVGSLDWTHFPERVG
jgi:hypothetical protein